MDSLFTEERITNLLSGKHPYRVTKTWHKFICHDLLPTSHDGDVTPNRCIFLYGICVGWPLNVRLIIWEIMKSVAKGPKTQMLPSVSLIHDMCRHARVVIGTSEPVGMVEKAIDKCCVESLLILKGGEEHDSGLGWFNYRDNHPPPRLPKRACNKGVSSFAATTTPQVTQPIINMG